MMFSLCVGEAWCENIALWGCRCCGADESLDRGASCDEEDEVVGVAAVVVEEEAAEEAAPAAAHCDEYGAVADARPHKTQ